MFESDFVKQLNKVYGGGRFTTRYIFKIGDIVEVYNKEFEFYKNETPTGQYMRGIIKEIYDEYFIINSLSDGKLYKIQKDLLVLI